MRCTRVLPDALWLRPTPRMLGVERSLGEAILNPKASREVFSVAGAGAEAYSKAQALLQSAKHSQYKVKEKNRRKARQNSFQSQNLQHEVHFDVFHSIFACHNIGRERDEIDLHGLTIKTALSCLDVRISQIMGHYKFIRVVVGKGTRLGPAVETYCWSRGLKWSKHPTNSGLIQIQTPPRTALAAVQNKYGIDFSKY